MIRLFINYYEDSDSQRQAELDHCLSTNLKHPLIDQVCVITTGRPSFNEYFSLANSLIQEGDISIITNLDIYFNDTLEHLCNIHESDVYALSRWDDTDRGLVPFFYVDSQDCWIFKGKIKNIHAPFPMGIPGCDNRLAYELKQAGYNVSNPSKTIQAIHLHRTNKRNYDQQTVRVEPPYHLLHHTSL